MHVSNRSKMTGTLSFIFYQQHTMQCDIRHTQTAPEALLYLSRRVTKISVLIGCLYYSKSKYSLKEHRSCAFGRSNILLPHVLCTNTFCAVHYIAASSVIFTAELVLFFKKQNETKNPKPKQTPLLLSLFQEHLGETCQVNSWSTTCQLYAL